MIFQDLSGKTALDQRRCPALDLGESEWDSVSDTNLKGVFVLAQTVARGMRAAGQALIRHIPQRRLGRPDELDGALLLLCAEAGSYIS
ncbi:MAG TPA: hypothetical protein VL101_14770, partial [Nordella sp.]|nr:hypothetical protein [Nordella sp.]